MSTRLLEIGSSTARQLDSSAKIWRVGVEVEGEVELEEAVVESKRHRRTA